MRLNLEPGVLFFPLETKEKSYMIHNSNNNKNFQVNNTVVRILELSNGRLTQEEIINTFDINLHKDIKDSIEFLIKECIIGYSLKVGLSIKLENIKTFYLSITNNCNLNCHFCLKNNQVNNKKDLELDDWKKIISNLYKYNREEQKTLYITGGEPLIHKHFKEIYKTSFEMGFKINIFSNGTMVTDNLIETFTKFPPNAIFFSVDGSTATIHDEGRGINGAFNKVIEGTTQIINSNIKTDIIWQSVITSDNFNDIENILQLAELNKIKNVRFGLITSIGLGIKNDKKLKQEMMSLFYEKIIEMTIKYKGRVGINQTLYNIQNSTVLNNIVNSCGIGNILHIDPEGNVTPCYGLTAKECYMGNILSSMKLKLNEKFDFYEKCIDDFESCSICGIRYLCYGGCKAEIYELEKNIHGCVEEKRNALIRYLNKVFCLYR